MDKSIALHINSQSYSLMVEPDDLLVDILRDKLRLTGAKLGCGTGDCGACTVPIDGKPVNSCLVLAVSSEGQSILTVEGLGDADNLIPLQQSFIENGAVQCGYCSPGFLMVAKALLDENPRPTEEEVRAAISGNLCRCTGYVGIVRSILSAAEMMRG